MQIASNIVSRHKVVVESNGHVDHRRQGHCRPHRHAARCLLVVYEC